MIDSGRFFISGVPSTFQEMSKFTRRIALQNLPRNIDCSVWPSHQPGRTFFPVRFNGTPEEVFFREFAMGECRPDFLGCACDVNDIHRAFRGHLMFSQRDSPSRLLLRLAKRAKAFSFIFANPSIGDFQNRDWVEEMLLLSPMPLNGNQVRLFQMLQVLGHCLPRHLHVFT